jgi:hypothetical protein
MECMVFPDGEGNYVIYHFFKKGKQFPVQLKNPWEWNKTIEENYYNNMYTDSKTDSYKDYELIVNRTSTNY